MLAAAAAKAAAKAAAASAKAAQVCPYCQGIGHSRKTSKQCRLYRAPAPQSPAGDAASIEGAVPAAAGVEAWTLNDNAGALRLVMYNEFRSSVFDQQAQKHLKEVVANLRQHHIRLGRRRVRAHRGHFA
jgi:hypothetical protein